ncbi:alkaline phosphatase D family protein [Seonamhaeicola sp.]|uniref:alkaline phosphatase D family protein n=1 Tax=Seonamhaeicola sp. TaxID=1912245 RepID=UPI002620C19A|nr:alkaline phosphatase D family protein [Seonamhaeicola sp.]
MITLKKPLLIVVAFLFGLFVVHGQDLGTYEYSKKLKPKDRICFALYTVHEHTVKMTAQFYPIQDFEPFEASLQLKKEGQWETVAHSRIQYPGYTAHFRLENWDDTKEVEYRVNFMDKGFYNGIIRKNPVDNDEFVMVTFSCNSIYSRHDGNIPKTDIIENLKKIKPDLLYFAGDQVYDHSFHLIHWLQLGRDFGEIIRNTPTITVPDDHDIGQGNLWGAGGKEAPSRHGNMGGYYMPVEYIKEVERAQTSHLPDPYDPTPVERGIGVYYTDLKWGGMSFAILEDRKFKSGPKPITDKVRKAHKGFNDLDPKLFDVPGATMLGDRQLKFLEDWTTDWENAEMKSVLSQTIFCKSANYGNKGKNEIRFDFDSNGWPQTGRNKALKVIRKSFSTMVAGDQHLGSVIRHGIDDWNDAGYSFAVPAVANFWVRWWDPKVPGKNRKKGAPYYTGEFLDGFNNKITVEAIANPNFKENMESGDRLNTRAAGYGIIRYDKPKREITFECWGRNVDMSDPNSKQYPGWPVTVSQEDNYSILNGFELPKLQISKEDQVVTVVEKTSGEVISSQRIKGSLYQPKVHQEGAYKIKIGEGDSQQTIEVQAKKKNRATKNISL